MARRPATVALQNGGMPVHANIGLSKEQREGVVLMLTPLLADEYLLYTKTRNYHWNVVGPQFNDLHKFFEAQYEELEDIVDDVAERARSLGGKAIGTLVEFLKHTRLKESPVNIRRPTRCWHIS
jgi:starvation-inducible DNA-binding protein